MSLYIWNKLELVMYDILSNIRSSNMREVNKASHQLAMISVLSELLD